MTAKSRGKRVESGCPSCGSDSHISVRLVAVGKYTRVEMVCAICNRHYSRIVLLQGKVVA